MLYFVHLIMLSCCIKHYTDVDTQAFWRFKQIIRLILHLVVFQISFLQVVCEAGRNNVPLCQVKLMLIYSMMTIIEFIDIFEHIGK